MSADDMLFDKRIVQRNVKKGLVEKKDVEKRIEQLPDRANQCEPINLGGDARPEPKPSNTRPLEDEPTRPAAYGLNGGSAVEPASFLGEPTPPAQA